jgi:hypothetical protein
MTARTVIPAANILAVSRDSFGTLPAAVAGAATMYYNATPTAGIQAPSKVLFMFVIGTTATVVTIRASSNGVNVAGTAQTALAPASTVFTQSTLGDLVSASTTSATITAGPLTGDRFVQPDGNIYIDLSQATSVTVYALQMPFNAL